MYPILFNKTATSFTTNGIGRLSEAASCKVVEERNGSYELEMEYPMTGIHFGDLVNDNIIVAKPFQNGGLQAFRIYKVNKKANGLAQIYARHISYQLSFIPVHPSFTAGSASTALNGLKSRVAENCPFTFWTNVTRSGTFIVNKPDSFRALLGGQEGSVLDIFHGEYEWDNYAVKLHESRGADNGVTITYGKNLIDLSQEENIENTITGIYPYWSTDGGQTTDGHTIYSNTTAYWNAQTTLKPNENDVYIYTDHGTRQNSDGTTTKTPGYKIGDGSTLLSALAFLNDDDERLLNVTTYIELDEKVVYSSNANNFPFKRSVVMDFTSEFENAPSQQQLRAYTQQYITENEIGVPKVSLDVKFINLFETPGYEDVAALQAVKLCDTVTVIFPKLNISSKAKVNKTDYDVLRERYNEIEIGDPKETFTNSVYDQMKQVSYMPTSYETQNMIDRATGVLNSGTRGHVIINRNSQGYANEILFLDDDNIDAAANVLRINMNGIGFSSNGYVGPYYQSWTNDGHLTLGGINNHYGTLEILDENANPTIWVDKEGLKILAVDYVGYLINGKFYYDSAGRNQIPNNLRKGYYNRLDSKLYKCTKTTQNNQTVYVYTQDEDAGVIAKMTHDGLDIRKGTIDLLMGEDVGFKADGSVIQLGEFVVENTNRNTFHDNVNTTGLSGPTGHEEDLFLWAGWHDQNNFRLAVNDIDVYTVYNGQPIEIGRTLYEYLYGSGGGGGGGGCSSNTNCNNNECPGDTCYSCYTDCETIVCSTCGTGYTGY